MALTPHQKLARAWLSGLANLYPTPPDIETKIQAMTPLLAAAFPDALAFTDESKAAMAALMHSFPSFGRLNDFLNAWWADHQPKTPEGKPDDLDAADMSAEDKMGVRIWLGHQRIGDLPSAELITRLAVIRRYHAAGYRWLIAHDTAAADIARQRGWHDAAPRPADDAEKEAVARMLHGDRRGTTDATGKPIPSGAPKQPDPVHQAAAGVVADQVRQRTGRTPGQVAPDILEAARAANANIAAAREYQEKQRAAAAASNVTPFRRSRIDWDAEPPAAATG
jgi:hypothetical protein